MTPFCTSFSVLKTPRGTGQFSRFLVAPWSRTIFHYNLVFFIANLIFFKNVRIYSSRSSNFALILVSALKKFLQNISLKGPISLQESVHIRPFFYDKINSQASMFSNLGTHPYLKNKLNAPSLLTCPPHICFWLPIYNHIDIIFWIGPSLRNPESADAMCSIWEGCQFSSTWLHEICAADQQTMKWSRMMFRTFTLLTTILPSCEISLYGLHGNMKAALWIPPSLPPSLLSSFPPSVPPSFLSSLPPSLPQKHKGNITILWDFSPWIAWEHESLPPSLPPSHPPSVPPSHPSTET